VRVKKCRILFGFLMFCLWISPIPGHRLIHGAELSGPSPLVSPSQPSTSVSAQNNIDPTGTWRHHAQATWTITATGDGRYYAQENGLMYAGGPAYWTATGMLRIDYTFRDGSTHGYYELRIAADGRTATGRFQELDGQKRSGPSNWARESGPDAKTQSTRTAAPSRASGNLDPTGTWRHHAQATWTITATGDGRYFAQENGLMYASGPAYWTQAGTLRIDYTFRDGSTSGYYEMRVAADGRTATGRFQELNGQKGSGPSNWVRESGPAVKPAPPVSYLTGHWVYSMDRNAAADTFDVIHEGRQVTFIQSWKSNGQWTTHVCVGTLAGRQIRFQCHYPPGGNPFGFSDHVITVQVSADASAMDGVLEAGGRQQEVHYRRVR